MSAWSPIPALTTLLLLVLGVTWLAVLDRVVGDRMSGKKIAIGPSIAAAGRDALRLLFKESRPTERPDRLLWWAAPVLLLTLVMVALMVMPLAPGLVGGDLGVGVVFFTAMFALVMVAVFAAAWGPNSKYPLFAGYRFIGLMLAYEMPFAIAIIGVALPAESLSVSAIAASQQATVWNVLLQPVGFAIYLLSALAVAFWGPFDMVGSPDLAGGVELEMGGAPLLLWRFAHYGVFLAASAFAVPLYLAGGAGPVLPPAVWSLLKILTLSSLLLGVSHILPRRRLDRFMKRAWVGLIPLSLANLFLVGLIMLVFPGLFGGGA